MNEPAVFRVVAEVLLYIPNLYTVVLTALKLLDDAEYPAVTDARFCFAQDSHAGLVVGSVVSTRGLHAKVRMLPDI